MIRGPEAWPGAAVELALGAGVVGAVPVLTKRGEATDSLFATATTHHRQLRRLRLGLSARPPCRLGRRAAPFVVGRVSCGREDMLLLRQPPATVQAGLQARDFSFVYGMPSR